MQISLILGIIYFVSEVVLAVTRRSRVTDSERQDKSTLRALWIVIFLSIAAGFYVALHYRGGRLPHGRGWATAGVVLFFAGLILRWWAIIVLGRFFTVDVAILKDHEVVDAGPFRVVRHPSYTGVLLAFLGYALLLGNWAAILVLFVPIFVAFVHRMNVEEQALKASLGDRYTSYMARTKRLVPLIY